jgi:hypothetical protein
MTAVRILAAPGARALLEIVSSVNSGRSRHSGARDSASPE